MADPGVVEQVLWPMTTFAMALLLCFLAIHKSYRAFPAFSGYVAASLLQALTLFLTYRIWGFTSPMAWRMSWISQAVVLLARTAAVVELCRHALGHFRGIWALAYRVLIAGAVLVVLFAVSSGRHEWRLALPTAEIAAELAIAAVIVVLLLFARYYRVPLPAPLRWLAGGLGFYSCISVINDIVLERWLAQYVSLWNLLCMMAFLVSLAIWIWAFRQPAIELADGPVQLDGSVYAALVPEINLRLRVLNDQLARYWNAEALTP